MICHSVSLMTVNSFMILFLWTQYGHSIFYWDGEIQACNRKREIILWEVCLTCVKVQVKPSLSHLQRAVCHEPHTSPHQLLAANGHLGNGKSIAFKSSEAVLFKPQAWTPELKSQYQSLTVSVSSLSHLLQPSYSVGPLNIILLYFLEYGFNLALSGVWRIARFLPRPSGYTCLLSLKETCVFLPWILNIWHHSEKMFWDTLLIGDWIAIRTGMVSYDWVFHRF